MRRHTPTLAAGALGALVALALVAATVQPPFVNGPLREGFPEMSERVDAKVLAAGVAESYTVPSDPQEPTERVPLSFSADCATWYLRRGGTAAAPTADITDGSGSIRNPSRRMFDQGDVLSFKAPTDCIVTIDRGRARF